MARAVAQTAVDRDRVLDLIRAAALVMVVVGHGIGGVVGWPEEGGVEVANTLSVYPWAAWATWLLQIMPLFFVAGGAVNARSWRGSTSSYPAWLWRRVARLLRPVWVYLAIMAPACGIISALVDPRITGKLLILATQLLWFIGVYVMVTALTPLGVAAHARSPWAAPLILLAMAAVVDWVRLGPLGLAPVGLLNFVIVWAMAAQWGMLLGSGRLGGWRGAGLAAAAVTANLVLVELADYPRSMVGLTGERFSNMAPPSLALAFHATALVGLVGVGHPLLARAAAHARVWRATVAVNLTAMTLYLWHLPTLVAMVAGMHVLGLDRPIAWRGDDPTPGEGFWLWTLPYLVAFGLLVVSVVRLMWPFEHRPLRGWDTPWSPGAARREHQALSDAGPRTTTGGPPRAMPRTQGGHARGGRGAVVAVAAGSVAIGVGTLALSATGLAGFPTRILWYAGVPINAAAAIALMALGGWLVRHFGSPNGNKSLP